MELNCREAMKRNRRLVFCPDYGSVEMLKCLERTGERGKRGGVVRVFVNIEKRVSNIGL